ncbi:BtpA/SgcQ family protein [Halovenus sp. WSH3]|uniref:BtpA/SgcQ family protein n=1 Tax=Halovenus carboxidivorans TaxID=2692199 RepID=A0A6B0T0R4_9EURY|nr:BtpA/SgcQ family protein [Halovenus carboxidivorans]MXR51634.1 BtpA/SgcQ family protein [Halovenus carboxidivorans]
MEPPGLGGETPLIGMVHLPALPGAPEYDGSRAAIRDAACEDARALAASGFDAVLIENFGDTPFYPDSVPKHTVAELTATARAVDGTVDVPVGVNVLRNDAEAALSVAAAVGGAFVRVNVHAGVRATDQGWLEGSAHETMRLRERLDTDVAVYADVDVKHSASPVDRDIGALARETVERGLADGLIVSGPETGAAAEGETLEEVVAARDDCAPEVPVLVGSGVTVDNAAALLEVADGAIVGTAVKTGGVTTNRVDRERASALVERVRN